MDLLESVEFGDWLIHEMARQPPQSPVDSLHVAKPALSRAQSLETAKVVLLEYLTLQDEMIRAASERVHIRAR